MLNFRKSGKILFTVVLTHLRVREILNSYVVDRPNWKKSVFFLLRIRWILISITICTFVRMFFLFGSDELMSLASLTNPHQSSLSVVDKGIRSAATQIDGSIRFSVYPSHSRDENPSISVSVRVYSWRGLAIYRPLGLKSLHARDLDIRKHLCVRHRDDDLRGIVVRYLLVYTRVTISGSMRVSLRSFSRRTNKDALSWYILLFVFT